MPLALVMLSAVPLVRLLNMRARCVHTEAVGVEVAPPIPTMMPPVILKVFWSQSKPSSGLWEPMAMVRPPVTVMVPLASMPSLLVACA